MLTAAGRWIWYSLASALLIILSGCTVAPTQPSTPATASSSKVAAFLTDAPANGIVAFRIDITGATLVGTDGTSTSISNGVQEIELRHLQLAPTLAFQTGSAPMKTYTALNMALANPQITTTDAQGNVTVLNANTVPAVQLANVTVSLPINMTLEANNISSLMIDFDLQRSLQIDSHGNYIITPELNVDAVSNPENLSSLQDAGATILSNPTPDVYTLQLQDTGQIVRIVTGPNTLLANDSRQPANLQTGQDVEFDAQLQTDGSFLASRINTVSSVSSNPLLCLRGVVVGVGSGSAGNAVAIVVQE
ncbi:MAG: DUF4382 domain-containing protein [Candidatus Acidiferrales bacterium]